VSFDPETFTTAWIFDTKIFVFAVMIGTLVGLMRLVDSMSGQEAHIASGEKSISVRFGLDRTVKIVKALMTFAYILAAAMVYFNPVFVLLFLTLPLAAKALKIMNEKSEQWSLKIPPFFFGNAFLTEILFVIAIIIISAFGIGALFG
jgi:1,4-dihydroxy-2-naphthoate octaprenyltransferase